MTMGAIDSAYRPGLPLPHGGERATVREVRKPRASGQHRPAAAPCAAAAGIGAAHPLADLAVDREPVVVGELLALPDGAPRGHVHAPVVVLERLAVGRARVVD